MAIATEPTISRLIRQFLDLMQTVHHTYWQAVDCASAIYQAGGSMGLHQLAEESGYAYSTLRHWVTLGQNIPVQMRHAYPDVSLSVFQTALHSAHRFPQSLPESTVEYWVHLAHTHHWGDTTLRRAVAQRFQMWQLNTPQAEVSRRDYVAQLTAKAEAEVAALRNRIEFFNRHYAPYYLKTLALTETFQDPLVG